jgi:hypothetical protein
MKALPPYHHWQSTCWWVSLLSLFKGRSMGKWHKPKPYKKNSKHKGKGNAKKKFMILVSIKKLSFLLSPLNKVFKTNNRFMIYLLMIP